METIFFFQGLAAEASRQWTDMQEALHNLILDLMLLANGGTGNLGVPGNQNRTGGGGVYATSDEARQSIKSSVEDDYEWLIDFDENGKVVFTDNNAALLIALKDKESNFAKLYAMATNEEYAFEVNLNSRDTEIMWYTRVYKNEKYCGSGTLNIINMADANYIIWGIEQSVGGIFIGSIIEGDYLISKQYDKNISEIYISNAAWYSDTYKRIFQPYQLLAHELYYHAYGMMMGRRISHGYNYSEIQSEIKKAGRR